MKVEIIFITKILFPKTEQISAIVQDNKGGLEKYPKSRFWDHNQYWASSPNKSKFVKWIAIIFIMRKNKHKKNNNLFFLDISFINF